MNHEQCQQYISQFIDHDLATAEAKELFHHLSGCDECRNFFQSTLELRTDLQRFEQPSVPAELDRRILAMPVSAKPRVMRLNSLSSLWSARILFSLPAAASIAFLLVVGALFLAPLFFSSTQGKPLSQQDSPALQELQRRGIIDRSIFQQ